MKRILPGMILAALAVVLASGQAVAEQENDNQNRQKRRELRRQRARKTLERIAKAAELTEQQQTQLVTAIESFAQDARNWHQENADKIQALRKEYQQAVEDGDKDKLKQLREKRKELMAGLKAKAETHHEQIVKMLGDEKGKKVVNMLQAARRRRTGRRHKGRAVAKALGDTLSDKQKNIIAETKEAVKNAEGREAKIKAAKEGREKLAATLTDEQKKKLATLRRRTGNAGHRPMERIKKALGDSLTDAQESILADTVKAVKEAENRQAKRQAVHDGMKKLRESLSDEQKETLRKAVGRARRRGGQRNRSRSGKGQVDAE